MEVPAPPTPPPLEGAPPPQTADAKQTTGTISWVRDLFLSVLIAIVVILFLYQPVKVEGTSMQPSLENDERVFINKFLYRFGISEIKRGDTVVFWYPNDTSKSYIKRVIGLPGDRVELSTGKVYVNGQLLQEPYVPDHFRDRSSMPEKSSHRTSSSCWATIAAPLTTAARAGPSRGPISTARPCSPTGRSTGWEPSTN